MEKINQFQENNSLSAEDMRLINGGKWKLINVLQSNCANAGTVEVYQRFILGIGTTQTYTSPDN